MVQSPIGNKRISESTLAIRVRNVSKSFPGVQALRKVSFVLETGEVHGLVGANGAGKSTFIRMLSGASTPDTGDIEVQGLPISFEDPRAQRDNGIAAIYQELTIIPEMSAVSNVFLGEVPNRWFIVDRRGMEKRFNELAEWMGVKISPHAIAKTLSVANQQMLEIMRAVHAEHDVIIMDEPTAPLGPFERARLYELIGRLKENNVSIIFISHDLDEVLRLCDRVSVMRDGQLIETRQSSGWTKDSLVKAMLGDIQIVPGRKRERGGLKQLLRGAKPVVARGYLQHQFRTRRGRGSRDRRPGGRGTDGSPPFRRRPRTARRGRMAIGGEDCPWPQSVREAIERGIALAPEDRKREGLVLSRSALCNLLLADINSASLGPVILPAMRRAEAAVLAKQIGFNPDRLDTDALHLSGGNQQKLVIGKWLHRRPRILLLDEPTRGIDLGAKQEIFQTIRSLSDEGMGVILVSSDLEEVVEHADRIVVMARGKQIATLEGHEASVERILNLIFAVESRPAMAGVNQLASF